MTWRSNSGRVPTGRCGQSNIELRERYGGSLRFESSRILRLISNQRTPQMSTILLNPTITYSMSPENPTIESLNAMFSGLEIETIANGETNSSCWGATKLCVRTCC